MNKILHFAQNDIDDAASGATVLNLISKFPHRATKPIEPLVTSHAEARNILSTN